MKVIQHGHGLEVAAYRTVRCVSCGTFLGYEEETFWQPAAGDLERAAARLMALAVAWKTEPLCCYRCPGKAAAA